MKAKVIKAVAWKEIRVLLRMAWPVLLLIYGAIVFGALFGVGHRGGGIVAAAAVVMFWSAFILSRHLFFSERLNRTFVNLLASPLTPEEIFLGKVVVCFTGSFAATALAAISYTVYIALRHGELPSAMELVATFVTIPVWGGCIDRAIWYLFPFVWQPDPWMDSRGYVPFPSRTLGR